MEHQLWSWVLSAVGIFGIWLAGQKKASGWAVGFSAQILWIAYAIATRQWGFIAASLVYATFYARNWFRWRREAIQVKLRSVNDKQ